MSFTSVGYGFFIVATAILYYLCTHIGRAPQKLQNAVLLAASIAFYGWNLPAQGAVLQRFLPLIVLAGSAIFTFFMARLISASTGRRKQIFSFASVAVCVALLCIFKYYNFFVPTVLGIASFAKLALPLGISFYTFASISYLVDVTRGDMSAETNFVAYAVFVCFFGTITSGPICRAKHLLPQLRAPRTFDAQRASGALRLALVGFFKQIAVANILGLYVNEIFSADLRNYQGLTLIFASVIYALQLYFEFSGYSDIAVATGQLLGVNLPINFKTPYFATNFSGFWNRWHITLSSWLQDYIFMPLVWSRWPSRLPVLGKKAQNPPVISSLVIVFLLSGLWHGNSLPFLVWGGLQAVYRVGEELLHRYYKKPAKKPGPALRAAKTAGVFCLWAASLVFFRVGLMENGTVADGLYVLHHQFTGISVSRFLAETSAAIQNGFYVNRMMELAYIFFVALVLCAAVFLDWYQCFRNKDRSISLCAAKLGTAARWLCYYALIGCVLAAYIMQSGGFGTTSFAYAGF